MKKIVLFCANGFTTAMMAKKLQEAIAAENVDYEANAYPFSELDQRGADADIILLGPQIRYNLKRVQEKYPEKPVIVLDMQAYAVMDGKKILSQVEELI